MGHAIEAFFAGMIFINALPHFVNGISGNAFPTPFAKPPGKGLSSPIVNALWAVFNFACGWLLWRLSRPIETVANQLALLVGCVVMTIGLAAIFTHRMRE